MSPSIWGRAKCLLFALAIWPSVATAGNLILADVIKRPFPIAVYEFPDNESREAAVRFAQMASKSLESKALMPQAELIDASAAGPRLADRLKNGFVLFTTLSNRSKLLKLATAHMGWSLEGDNFHWHDLTTPAATAAMILAAPNPYGDGYCIIFAAGSNQTLSTFQSSSDGSASFYLYQGHELLKSGLYDQDFILKTGGISQAEALDDINQFFATLERVHPNLLARINQQDYTKLKADTIRAITKLDSRSPVAIEDLVYPLSYAAAAFKDGHTSVQWHPWSFNGEQKRLPAFTLTARNVHFFVATATRSDLAGAELLAVNGIPILEFLRPVLDRCSGETLAFRITRFLAGEPGWYYLTNLFGNWTTYRLKLQNADGRQWESPLDTLTFGEYNRFRAAPAAGQAVQPGHQGTSVEFLASGAVAHFLYSSFRATEDEKQKVNRIFEQLQEKKIRDLIIDIRGNGGGSSNMADFIFGYLYSGKFDSFSRSEVKLSADVQPWLAMSGFPGDQSGQYGKVVTLSNKERTFPKPAAFFTGNTYLLIDNGTFSAATGFATMIRDYKVGTILGYETGGTPISFGESYSFKLRNSSIPVSVSWKHFYPPKPRPGDDQHGVLPNVPMSEELLTDFKNEKDPVLAYTLHYIQAKSGQAGPPR